jgi:hypothetical protein
VTARISGDGCNDTVKFAEWGLHTPETTAGKSCLGEIFFVVRHVVAPVVG